MSDSSVFDTSFDSSYVTNVSFAEISSAHRRPRQRPIAVVAVVAVTSRNRTSLCARVSSSRPSSASSSRASSSTRVNRRTSPGRTDETTSTSALDARTSTTDVDDGRENDADADGTTQPESAPPQTRSCGRDDAGETRVRRGDGRHARGRVEGERARTRRASRVRVASRSSDSRWIDSRWMISAVDRRARRRRATRFEMCGRPSRSMRASRHNVKPSPCCLAPGRRVLSR